MEVVVVNIHTILNSDYGDELYIQTGGTVGAR
jgi:hypothetical protein